MKQIKADNTQFRYRFLSDAAMTVTFLLMTVLQTPAYGSREPMFAGDISCEDNLKLDRILGQSAAAILDKTNAGYLNAWTTRRLANQISLFYARNFHWNFKERERRWEDAYTIKDAHLDLQLSTIAAFVEAGFKITEKARTLIIRVDSAAGVIEEVPVGSIEAGVVLSRSSRSRLTELGIDLPFGFDSPERWPPTKPASSLVGRRCRFELASGENIVDVIKTIRGGGQYDDGDYIDIPSRDYSLYWGQDTQYNTIRKMRCEPL